MDVAHNVRREHDSHKITAGQHGHVQLHKHDKDDTSSCTIEHGTGNETEGESEESATAILPHLDHRRHVNLSQTHLSRDEGYYTQTDNRPVPVFNAQEHLSAQRSALKSDRTQENCRLNFAELREQCAELSKENLSLRSRLKGINVLSTLLSESRDEIANLNTQKNKMEIAVENLQSRLHRLGADTSVDLAEHEIFMPGHDKQFLNSLISENMRLQKALKGGARDSSAVVKEEQQTERIKKLETIVQQLTEQRREKEKLLQQLHDSMKASGEEKDKELAKLREKVVHLTQARENAEAICESLTDQAEMLREQVQTVSKGCEEATNQLQKQKHTARQKESDEIEHELIKMKRAASNLKPEEQIRILEQQVDQLEKENARLTDQLKEVIGMNTRWQRYNDQREAYVIKLSKTSYQQQSKITVLEQRCSDLNKENDMVKKDNDMLKRQEENNRDAALVSADQQLVQKDEEIGELKARVKELADLVRSSMGCEKPSDISDKDKIQMLEHQVNTFAADFKEERQDRERLQSRYTSALKELREKDHYIQELQEQLQQGGNHGYSSQRSSTYFPYNRQQSCRQDLIALGQSRIPYYGEDIADLPTDVEVDGRRGFDEPDGLLPEAPRDDEDYEGVGAAGAGESGEEPLQCPHCFREFIVSEHEKFMQHVLSCIEQS